MAPPKSTKARTKDIDSGDDDATRYTLAPEHPASEVVSRSGDQDMNGIMQLAQQRQVAKRRQAEKAQTALVAHIRSELTILDDEHSEALAALRRERLTSLQEALRDKAAVETEILQSLQTLQKAQRATSSEVRVALTGRISDLA